MAISKKNLVLLKKIYAYFDAEDEVEVDPEEALNCVLSEIERDLPRRRGEAPMLKMTLESATRGLVTEHISAREAAELKAEVIEVK